MARSGSPSRGKPPGGVQGFFEVLPRFDAEELSRVADAAVRLHHVMGELERHRLIGAHAVIERQCHGRSLEIDEVIGKLSTSSSSSTAPSASASRNTRARLRSVCPT